MGDTLNNYDLLDEIKKTSILSADDYDLWRVTEDCTVQAGGICGSSGGVVDYDYIIEAGWYLLDTTVAVEIVDSHNALMGYGSDLYDAAERALAKKIKKDHARAKKYIGDDPYADLSRFFG